MPALSREEFIALGEIAKARRSLLVNMFTGTQLKFGVVSSLESGKSLLSTGKKLRSNAGKLASGGKEAAKGLPSLPGMHKLVEDFILECADVNNISDIVAAVTSEALKDLIAEVTPVLGVVASGVKLAKASKAVAEDGYHLYKCNDYKKGFLRGDPLAAAEAVQSIIRRDLGKHSVQLAQQATATGAKIAGLFADLGTGTTAGIGIANALASLGLQLYGLGLDIKDMRAGNKRLLTPDTLDLTVFEESPILGCYLITCADTSSVANFFVADIGLPGWMDKVEQLKKKQMDPLLKIATKDINASRLQLEGLSSNKGTHAKKDFFARIKSKAVKRLGLA
ncbi:hypothetical protein M8A51_15405 [Schlegelella sp. S2-27]|uniref:Uncharacterized protein n=1 Tax=Caldimonas mangrovi TaxID=2944811 RepID=A0ABT0YRK9_9BURK|nr:hypothetical protein [Caldimonas mangrovi]MCM5680912.1 hypothetical protein [Caldimonas mangrovi]